MSTPPAPRRWLDAPEDAPTAFRHAAAAYSELGASPAVRARAYETLQSRASQLKAARTFLYSLGGAGLVLLAVGAYAVLQQRSVPHATRVQAAPAASPAPASTANPVVTPAPAPLEQPAPVLDVSETRAEPAARRARSRREASVAAPAREQPTATPRTAGEVQSELQLLMRARRVVGSAPTRALELTEEHSARYPAGSFAEEREVIAVEALLRLGRTAAAQARARAFHVRYPLSIHRQRIEEILAAP